MVILQDILDQLKKLKKEDQCDFFRATQANGNYLFFAIRPQAVGVLKEVLADAEPKLGGYLVSGEKGAEAFKTIHQHPSGDCTYAFVMSAAGNCHIETP
jgi:proteasome lid subunit RPN8/RPN11